MGCGSSLPTVPFTQVVQGQLVNGQGQAADAQQLLQKKVKLVYFGNLETAQFAQVYLAPFVARMKQANKCDFECIYVSWDQNEANFKQMAAMGPWWSIPFQDFNRRTQLGYALQVGGPPTLIVVDEEDGLITPDGVQQVQQDFNGNDFPWRPSKLAGAMEMLAE